MQTKNKKRVGFDFDKVFVNTPPLIPDKIVDILYKGYIAKNRQQNYLKYKFPNKIEQQIRILSHHPLFRKPITTNINALSKISTHPNMRPYLISSRFGFLKKRTDNFLTKHNFHANFHGIYFNYKNEQPHKFKLRMIKKLKIEAYIDDDADLIYYLSNKHPKTQYFLLSKKSRTAHKSLPKNIRIIRDLRGLRSYL